MVPRGHYLHRVVAQDPESWPSSPAPAPPAPPRPFGAEAKGDNQLFIMETVSCLVVLLKYIKRIMASWSSYLSFI